MNAKEQQLSESVLVPFTLRELLFYLLRLGTLGFGGPIALAGHMQRDLVEGRRWVSKQDYLEGLAFAQGRVRNAVSGKRGARSIRALLVRGRR